MELSNAAAVPTGSEEDDEILLILAEQLGQLVLCGLIPGYRALTIVSILEKLAGVEETVVRDKAVESLNSIIPELYVEHLSVKGKEEEEARIHCVRTAPGLLLAMVKRMANADWFTAKVSACAVLPVVYQFFNNMKSNATVPLPESLGFGDSGGTVEDTKQELRHLYKMLTEDEAPMVRRGAGKNLAKYVEAVATLPYGKKGATGEPIAREMMIASGSKDEILAKKTVTSELKHKVTMSVVPLYQALCSDEQDNIRLLAVGSSGSIGCGLGLDATLTRTMVLPFVKNGATDLSWRVRNNLAKDFAIVAQAMGFHESSHKSDLSEVLSIFASLLQDYEAQVRTSAVGNIARMTQIAGVQLFKQYIAPYLRNLAEDPVVEIRSKLAQTIMDCCDESICSSMNDEIIIEDFKPCLESLLGDEFAEVQLHILSKLNRVTRLLDKMDVVVQSVLNMSKAANWRVREAVGYLLPHLTEAMGVEFFETQLFENIWMELLMDQVADVRASCVSGMSKLLSVTGSEWIMRSLIPRYTSIYNDSNSYLTRITILRSMSKLASDKNVVKEDLVEQVVNLLLKGLNEDTVVNVRIVSAKGFEEISESLSEAMTNAKIIPALQRIVTEDSDEDCKFFAQHAIETLGK
jgi:serine/threonine-protein phosphatase 2A regulatory subunit A